MNLSGVGMRVDDSNECTANRVLGGRWSHLSHISNRRITVELTRRRESKHPPPHHASCERRPRRSRPTICYAQPAFRKLTDLKIFFAVWLSARFGLSMAMYSSTFPSRQLPTFNSVM